MAETHSWLKRNGGTPIRWSQKDWNDLALLHLAYGQIALKKADAHLALVPTGSARKVLGLLDAAAPCQNAPRPLSTTGTVESRIPTSRPSERFSM